MGSLGDDSAETKPIQSNPNVDFAYTQTQPFDTQLSPASLTGEKGKGVGGDELPFLQCTVPFDDTVQLEDGFETQVLNLVGETQILDDADCAEDMATQLIDEFDNKVAVDSDGEGTDRTEVLEDGDELSDDGSVRRVGGQSVDGKKMQCTNNCEHGMKGVMERPDALTREQRNSDLHVSTGTPLYQGTREPKPGSVLRFTSVRVESLRASGLRARDMALKGTSSGSFSIVSNSQSSEQHSAENKGISLIRDSLNIEEGVYRDHDMEKCNQEMNGSRNGNKCRVGSSAVRKLFTEDSVAENKGFSYECINIDGEDLLQLPACDDTLAGLSYVDSQEPGELSQANALEFVDRFLKDNVMEFDQEVERGKSTLAKSKSVSSAKGQQSLAKRTNDRSTVGETGIFDWDDRREDEGGGDIFRRRKEEFFDSGCHGRRSVPQPRKPKESKLDENGDKEVHLGVHDKRTGLVHSDSRLLLHNARENRKIAQAVEMNLKRNLANELDSTCTNTDVPEMPNVGFDTQMAAAAMETLCYGDGLARHDANDTHQGIKDSSKGSPIAPSRGKTKNRVCPKPPSIQKRVCPDSGVVTRQSKKTKMIGAKLSKDSSIPPQKLSKNVRKRSDTEIVITKSKRSKSNAVEHFTNHGNLDKMPSKIIEQKKAGALGKSCIDKSDRCNANETNDIEIDALSYPRGRSHRNLSGRLNGSDNLDGSSKPYVEHCISRRKRSRCNARSSRVDVDMKRKTRSSVYACPVLSSVERNLEGTLSKKSSDKQGFRDAAPNCNSTDMNGKVVTKDLVGGKEDQHSDSKNDADYVSSAENAEVNGRLDQSPREKCKPSNSASTTPINCRTPVNAASPVCMGNEYFKQTCKKNLSRSCLMKELSSLSATGPEPASQLKYSRKRRDMANVRVLYSHHLDEDIIKQQKKILVRLGVSVASSITDATHFITDKFVRTRNMLEAIASGKPVVTHLWIESCGQASCFIDEKNYILRDAKKEKEFGFSMPVSLARACQCPLLQGRRVLITPNTKPDKEIILSLVKTVHGQSVERVGRSALKDDKIPDDLLVLSCEEDYTICVPFLEKGAAVYSSELLLNGIVTQKLEYERHRLFADQVKSTRSTIWLRKDGNKFQPVAKRK